MIQASSELQKSVRSFAKAVSRSSNDANPWDRLLCHDAPRALGDTFLACLGAIVLDGAQGCQSYSYLDAKKVLEWHVVNCKNMPIDDNAAIRVQGLAIDLRRILLLWYKIRTALSTPSVQLLRYCHHS